MGSRLYKIKIEKEKKINELIFYDADFLPKYVFLLERAN
jgi:hypothetical protein